MKKIKLGLAALGAVALSSCLGLVKGTPVDTGADPFGLARSHVDVGLTHTGTIQTSGASTRVAPAPVTKSVPLPSASFNDITDFNTYAAKLSSTVKDLTSWTPCYGFKSATVKSFTVGTTLPSKITLSSVSAVINIQDGVSPQVSVTLKTDPATATIELTKDAGAGATYTVSATNNKLCVVIPGSELVALNTIISSGGKNTVTGNLTYTVNQDQTIGGTPTLDLEFDAGSSTLIL
jgi:hypothetical protein